MWETKSRALRDTMNMGRLWQGHPRGVVLAARLLSLGFAVRSELEVRLQSSAAGQVTRGRTQVRGRPETQDSNLSNLHSLEMSKTLAK